MDPFILFCLIVLVPVVLAVVLGVNSVLLFLSVAAGVLLEQAFADSAVLVVSGFISNSPDVVTRVALLAAPVLFTLVFLRKSTKPSAAALQLIPLFLTALTFGYLILGRLDPAVAEGVYATPGGSSLQQASDLVVGLAVILNLLLAWRLYRHKADHGKHGKHH